ncbi:hypothetical protein PP175_25790 (plasmid) [Aneurinibacillus sp. Ricciae_BoGa-3]|uniref:hypothetical protein n=1 Tax=Aneurinibacillus sp. Ricciae_BoGa-3 TaxID=3022697 RepID=UPI0023412650|nr:hypothetical protein [Aneurinibacillus sp. Ricciae_BoGa-3]WCK57481.1 hypothetical protein PP175_25790 [Aneurinibacillus sp. Ricciae_BoGa-3]
MVVVKLLYIEDDVAVVTVDGVRERYNIQVGRENFIEVPDDDGNLIVYTIRELQQDW